MRGYEMGDPRDARTRLGPMQSVDARDDIHAQVDREHRARARGCCSAARSPTGRAPGIRATVLTNVDAGQPAHDEEVFGPVAAIIEAEDEARRDPRSPTPANSGSARAC